MKGDFTRFTHDPTKHYTSVLKQQGRVDLDADWNEWNDIQEHLQQTTNKDVIGACGVPMHEGGFEIGFTDDGPDLDLTISPGRIYVDGILCELEEEDVSYLHQPDYPNPPPLGPEDGREEGRTDLVYLDVWQRHITAIEDPDIREVALGGPDTATRVKTVWQVKVLEGTPGLDYTCLNFPWDDATAPSTGRLSTPVPPSDDEGPCIIAPGGGYQGLENRLYRVEIHEGSDSDAGPTFKWSRDNGSVVFAIEEFVAGEPTKVKVKRLGKDQVLAMRVGDWVEVLDDAAELAGEPGTLAQIVPDGIDETERILTLDQPISGYDLERHPKVRRWDQKETSTVTLQDGAIQVQEGACLELEDGIQIYFRPGGTYRTGDYWVFAARTAAGTIEELNQAPPHGIEHHYCRLALITWGPRAVRTLVSWIEGHAEPGLARSWEVAEDGLTWTFYLFRDLDDPEAVKVILDENRDRLTGYVEFRLVDRRTIKLVLAERNRDFLEQLSEIPISEQLVARVEDCRKPFPPLTEITPGGHDPYLVLRYVGGDGQEGPLGERLPCRLAVGVEDENGRPQAGVKIAFDAASGDVLNEVDNPSNDGNVIEVLTNHNGIAEVWWTLEEESGCHRVVARLEDPPQETALEVHFQATAREAWPTIEEIKWSNGQQWFNDQPVSLATFNEGLEIHFSKTMDSGTASLDTFIVTLELPTVEPPILALLQEEQIEELLPELYEALEGYKSYAGHRIFIVPGKVVVIDHSKTWTFYPEPEIPPEVLNDWLEKEKELFGVEVAQIRCRVVLKGNVILSVEEGRPLDGDVFGGVVTEHGGSFTKLILPSGDGNRGGDFESWFYLVSNDEEPD